MSSQNRRSLLWIVKYECKLMTSIIHISRDINIHVLLFIFIAWNMSSTLQPCVIWSMFCWVCLFVCNIPGSLAGITTAGIITSSEPAIARHVCSKWHFKSELWAVFTYLEQDIVCFTSPRELIPSTDLVTLPRAYFWYPPDILGVFYR